MLKTEQQLTGFILGIFFFAGAILPITGFAQDYKDSPFGIFGANEHTLDSPEISTSEEINTILTDLGTDWTTWKYFEEKYTASVNLFAGIGFEGGGILPNLTEIPSTYKPALREVIKANKEYAKYWNVQTEPEGAGGWFDNPEGYVKLLKARVMK